MALPLCSIISPFYPLFLYFSGELMEEADVVLGIEAEVVYAVFELADAFHAHAECEAGVFVGIDTEVVEHFGMHHATTEDLYPAGVFT